MNNCFNEQGPYREANGEYIEQTIHSINDKNIVENIYGYLSVRDCSNLFQVSKKFNFDNFYQDFKNNEIVIFKKILTVIKKLSKYFNIDSNDVIYSSTSRFSDLNNFKLDEYHNIIYRILKLLYMIEDNYKINSEQVNKFSNYYWILLRLNLCCRKSNEFRMILIKELIIPSFERSQPIINNKKKFIKNY